MKTNRCQTPLYGVVEIEAKIEKGFGHPFAADRLSDRTRSGHHRRRDGQAHADKSEPGQICSPSGRVNREVILE